MSQLEDDLTPILSPILALLRSRRFIVALITAIVDLLVLAVPALQPQRDQLLAVFTTLGLAWIGTTSAEDIAAHHADAKVEAARHEAEAMKASAAIQSAKSISSPEGSDSLSRPHR